MARSIPNPNTAGAAVKEAFEKLGGAHRSAGIVAWINEQYPGRWEERTLRSHLRGCSVNHPTAISYHPAFPRFLFNHGGGKFELYDVDRHGVFDEKGYSEGQAPPSSDLTEELREITEELSGKGEFAYEAHLRDYLAKNLSLLEPGLTLWTGDVDSIEYAIEGRRIDILARDKSGLPVIVELKLSRGHERTLGQALYYRGKLKQLLQVPRIRIIMVAAEITDELRIASTEVADVDLFSYALTMQVQKVHLTV